MTNSNHYEELGLMVGLELHQQLATTRKLYCHCASIIRDDKPDGSFIRRLRPTQSELGEVDPAALFEFQKRKRFYYEFYNDTTCLVEADEEPPHEMCEESIDIGLTMANFLESKVADEIHPMRKIVIDGSNTSGFQRTAILATGGRILIGQKTIGIQTICLEEDAARKIAEDQKNNICTYRLDRLGIPLIEIATAPDIRSPSEAQEVALAMGLLLRSTGRVKRGLGTIRQDVNVSITDGAIIEIKGLQQLDLLALVVELEALRQERLLLIREKLQERGISEDTVIESPVDVSDVFAESQSKIIKKTISSGETIFAVRLPGFAGLVGFEIQPGRRLGTELADHARFWSGVGGLFHTDELPKYGITEIEVQEVKKATKASDNDAVVIVAASEKDCKDALQAVVRRAQSATVGVPAETRAPLSDGTTKYARPRPGAERMYPETDVRPVKIDGARLKRIKRDMPETLDDKEKRFVDELGLNEELAGQMVRSLHLDLFENLVSRITINSTVVAVTLLNTVTSLHRDGIPTENLNSTHFFVTIDAVAKDEISSDAIPDILTFFANYPDSTLDEALSRMGITKLETSDVAGVIQKIVDERADFIRQEEHAALTTSL
ncbi:MAG: Glu-tRNA(Gln) amidotransferase subunit GatE [Candidatus Thorarchaeota archaeon]|jgi:glutamyl-tRNA(Gln) amidotransferase subunit E